MTSVSDSLFDSLGQWVGGAGGEGEQYLAHDGSTTSIWSSL